MQSETEHWLKEIKAEGIDQMYQAFGRAGKGALTHKFQVTVIES